MSLYVLPSLFDVPLFCCIHFAFLQGPTSKDQDYGSFDCAEAKQAVLDHNEGDNTEGHILLRPVAGASKKPTELAVAEGHTAAGMERLPLHGRNFMEFASFLPCGKMCFMLF